MNTNEMIQQLPFKLTKVTETRTIHAKDEHLLNSHKVGEIIPCEFWIDNNGRHFSPADIKLSYELLQINLNLDEKINLEIEQMINQIEIPKKRKLAKSLIG